MKQNKRVDYIIVGQGMAGSCLALQLTFRNKSVAVFDLPPLNRSTSVAAGLFNPISGKMLAKASQAELTFPFLHSFYPRAESFLKARFFYPSPVYRPFLSVEEQNEWMGRSTHASMKEYIELIFLKSVFGEDVFDPHGGVLLKHGGYLDTRTFTASVRSMLEERQSYREEGFEEGEVHGDSRGITYRDLSARRIVFCGGVTALNSRFFSWLPIKPLKGETLLIEMPEVERVYNRGVYVVPEGRKGKFTVGATYDFDLTPSVTEKGRSELEAKLRDLVRLPFSVISQNWGIRPTTPDRRVMLGPHPSHPEFVAFNGLGTKGVTLAPYFSEQLTKWLEGEGEIDPQVNIQRFKSLYFEV